MKSFGAARKTSATKLAISECLLRKEQTIHIDNNFVFRPCSSANSLFVVVVVYYLSFGANNAVSCFIFYDSLFLKIVEIK